MKTFLVIATLLCSIMSTVVSQEIPAEDIPASCSNAAIECSEEMVISQLYAENHGFAPEILPGWTEAVAARNEATQLALNFQYAEATEKFLTASALFEAARGADD